jgi:putative ABC transport system substrate-binding protein
VKIAVTAFDVAQEGSGNSKLGKAMHTKSIVWLLTTALISIAPLVNAQQAKKIARIGFLVTGSSSSASSRVEAFRQELRELGYAEGKDIAIEYRYAGGKSDRLPDQAAELVRLKVDVLVAQGAPAAHAAKNATTTIPIVIGNAADPVGTGLVASLARPGGNITGLSDFNVGVITKRLELLKEMVPTASRIAVMLNPANPTNPLQLKDLQAIAPALRVALLSLEVKGPDDIEPAFATMKKQRAAALIVVGDPMFGSHRARLIELTANSRLPAIWSVSEYVTAGGLMSYGTDFDDLFRRAAIYVDKILKGAKPADLPVEQPTTFELVINLKAAKQIGLTIPPNVLARADRVIR